MRQLSVRIAVAVVAAGLAGCHGCYKPPPSSTLVVAFVKPTDGQNLTSTDNTQPTQPGFHYTVVAKATDSTGGTVTLSTATLQIRPVTSSTQVPGPAAVISAGQATFTDAVLTAGGNVLYVSVTDSSNRQATAVVSVTVGVATPTVTITKPASGATINASNDADPNTAGFQLAFAVSTTGLSGDTGVLFCPTVCGIPPTNFTVGADGTASFNVTLTENACEQEAAQCTAVVTQPGGAQVTSAPVSFTLDTVAPQVVLYAPFATWEASQSFAVQSMVSCAEDNSPATLTLDGGMQWATTVQGGQVTFPSVSVSSDGQYAFTLSVTDKGGNVTNVPLPVTVESSPPTVSVAVTGATAGTVTSDFDGNAANGVQAQVVVTVNSDPVGTEVDLFTTVSGTLGQPRRANTVAMGSAHQATFVVDLAEGSNTLKVCATNVARLQSCQLVPLTVNTSRSQCQIASPTDNTFTNAGMVSVAVQAVAGTVTVKAIDSNGVAQATGTGNSTGGQVQVSLTLPADGAYHLVATCAGTGVSQNLPITLDTAAPAVSALIRGDPNGTFNLGPSVLDTSPLPGMQIVMDVTTKPYASVSATISGSGCGSGGASGTADGSGKVALRDITIPETGICQLGVTATDVAGNVGMLTKTLTLGISGGTLSVSSPQPGSILTMGGDGGTGVVVPVTFNFTAPAGTGTLTLTANGMQVGSQPVASTDTTKTFANVSLVEGSNVLRGSLTDGSGNTDCTAGIVYVNTAGAGAISLIRPTSGDLILTNDLDLNTPGIQTTLQYTANPKTTTFSVDVCTSAPFGSSSFPCKDGSGWFTLATNVPLQTQSFTFPDGAYSLKVVLDDSGVITASTAVNLVVDSLRPKVLSVQIPADTNGDGTLSKAELSALNGSPAVAVIQVSALDTGGTASVATTAGQLLGPSQTSNGSGSISVPLSGLPGTQEAAYALVVNLSRSSGNPNKTSNPSSLDPLNTAAFFTLNVDNNVPTVSITAPSKAVLGIADVPGNQVTVSALVPDTDIPTGGVAITTTAAVTPTSAQLTPSGGQVSQTFTLTQTTGVQTDTFNLVATDSAGNPGPASVTVTIVLSAPTITVMSPTTANPYVSHTVPFSMTVSGYNVMGQSVTVTDNGMTLGTLIVGAGGVASGNFNVANGTHTFGFSVLDGAGNVSAPTSVTPVVVSAAGCSITLTKPGSTPVYFGQADDLQPGTPGLQYQVQGVTPDCNAAIACAGGPCTVTLCSGAGPCNAGNTLGTTTPTVGTGAFTFPVVTFTDPSSNQQFTVSMNNGVLSSDTVTYSVKLTPPTVAVINPSTTPVFYVAPSNVNFLTGTSNPAYIVDQAPGNPGFGTANFQFNVGGAGGGTATLTYGGTLLGTTAVPTSPDPYTVNFTGIHLTQQSNGTLAFSATDPANNTTTSNVVVTKVDVVPPAASTLTGGLADGGYLQDYRAGTLSLSWTPSGDDGTTGTPQGYDLRWSDNTLLSSGIQNDTNYFNSAVTQRATGALLPPTVTLPYSLAGLPTWNTYSVSVRAVDGVGNYAPFQPATSIPNTWTKIAIPDPGSGSPDFGFHLDHGDVTGDGVDDLVVGSPVDGFGKVWIYPGTSNGPDAGYVIKLTPPGATVNETYGVDFVVDKLIKGQNAAGLAIGSSSFGSSRGRALLYGIGSDGGFDPTTYVEFRGTTATTGNFGQVVKSIGDINGDGYSELIIVAGQEPPGGMVYLYYGRPLTGTGSWQALATANDCGVVTPCYYIPTSSADHVFTADVGVTAFGRKHGYATLGTMGGTVNDFTVPASLQASVDKVYVESGQTVSNKVGPVLGSDAIQILSQTPIAGAGVNGFGAEAVGVPAGNLLGSPTMPDLVVTYPTVDAVYLYADGTATGFGTPSIIHGSGAFGFGLQLADLNGDGSPDLLIGSNNTTNGTAWLFFNKKIAGNEFDTTTGIGFAQSSMTTPLNLGVGVSIGDFNADARPDVAISDPLGGVVYVWY